MTNAEIRVFNYKHEWTIEEFSSKLRECFLDTDIFTDDAGDNYLDWSLSLYPKGKEYISDTISVYLFVVHNMSGVGKVAAKAKLGIVSAKGEYLCLFESQKIVREDDRWGVPRFMKMSILLNEKHELMVDDKLTIYCEITATVGGDVSATPTTPPIESMEFEIPLQNQGLRKVTIVVDGKEFPAHKDILAAHSPVFRAMFQNNMQENITNRVEIEDLDENIMEEFINFIYTGEINNLKEIAQDMYRMADRYDVNNLKIMCKKAMLESITCSTAVELFIFSDMFQLTTLRKKVKEFIVACAGAIGSTPKFELMVHDYPHLAVELFQALNHSGFELELLPNQ